MKKVIADAGYKGTPGGLVWRVFGWIWKIVERDPEAKGFVVLKQLGHFQVAWSAPT